MNLYVRDSGNHTLERSGIVEQLCYLKSTFVLYTVWYIGSYTSIGKHSVDQQWRAKCSPARSHLFQE